MFYVILMCPLLFTKCLIVQTDYVSMHLNELVQFNGQRRGDECFVQKVFATRGTRSFASNISMHNINS